MATLISWDSNTNTYKFANFIQFSPCFGQNLKISSAITDAFSVCFGTSPNYA